MILDFDLGEREDFDIVYDKNNIWVVVEDLLEKDLDFCVVLLNLLYI